jgi:hypothetical protein
MVCQEAVMYFFNGSYTHLVRVPNVSAIMLAAHSLPSKTDLQADFSARQFNI